MPVHEGDTRCSACGSPRLVTGSEVFGLGIAHVDCDAFFASIEKRDRPELRDRPVVVGGGRRGVVAAACYIARTWGIRSAMPVAHARRLCPDLEVIPPDKDKYSREGRKIREIMLRFTPLVEPLSVDEAFLDLTGTERLHGAPPAVVLARLARLVERETGLTISIGLSYNKFLAKMASDLDKPRGFSVISEAGAQDFLNSLQVRDLWGVGPASAKALERHGIRSVRQLAQRDRAWLVARLGRLGAHLHDLSRGHDPRPVTPEHETKSVSAEMTFEQDVCTLPELESILWRMARKVMKRAMEKRLAGHVVTVKLRRADFIMHTASTRLDEPTLLAGRIFRAARPLLQRLHDGAPCRLVGVGISRLVEADERLLASSLDERMAREAKAELAAERLRKKFGDGAVDLGLGLPVRSCRR